MSGQVCACGHPEVAHWTPSPGTDLRPCSAAVGARHEDYCPCITWRPREPAPAWLRAANALLGRIAR